MVPVISAIMMHDLMICRIIPDGYHSAVGQYDTTAKFVEAGF